MVLIEITSCFHSDCTFAFHSNECACKKGRKVKSIVHFNCSDAEERKNECVDFWKFHILMYLWFVGLHVEHLLRYGSKIWFKSQCVCQILLESPWISQNDIDSEKKNTKYTAKFIHERIYYRQSNDDDQLCTACRIDSFLLICALEKWSEKWNAKIHPWPFNVIQTIFLLLLLFFVYLFSSLCWGCNF